MCIGVVSLKVNIMGFLLTYEDPTQWDIGTWTKTTSHCLINNFAL